MNFKEIIEKLFGFSAPTWYRWKKEQRLIVDLMDKYFEEKNLEEFINTGKINKFEQQEAFLSFLNNLKKQYFDFIRIKFVKLHFMHELQAEFYFQYLYYLKDKFEQFEIHGRPFSAAAFSFALKFKIDNIDGKQLQKSINEFSDLIDLIEFLDDTPGMLFYFKYLLENDLKPLLDGIDINEYSVNNKISVEATKSIYEVEELSHYYLYHSYNYSNSNLNI